MSQDVMGLISQLREKNIHLKLDGEKLKINAPKGALTDDIKTALKKNKSDIIAFLKTVQSGSDSIIGPVDRGAPLLQSMAQERLWVIDQLQSNASFNMAYGLKIKGPLRLEFLQQAFQAVVNRHESLRTCFAAGEQGEPVQVIRESIDFDLPLQDLSDLEVSKQDAKAAQLAQEEMQTLFDLSRAPLLRAKVLKLSPVASASSGDASDQHILLFSMHHIIADGWSLGVLVRDVMQHYGALLLNVPAPVAPLSIQYADFSQWQRDRLTGKRGEERVAYWTKNLHGVPDLLDLPTDNPRPEQQSFRGAAHLFSFSERETETLKQCAQAHDVTLFMVLLAGFQVLLGRLSQQEDVSIGVPVSGRDNPQTQALIGFFINALVMRGDMRGNPSVKEYLHRVRDNTLGAFEHQDVPMEEVLKKLALRRNAAFNPGAQVGFSWQSGLAQDNPEDGLQSVVDLTVEPFDVPQSSSIQDLTLSLWEGPSGIEGRLEYATDLFDPDTIAQWTDFYRHVLAELATQPDESLCNLEIFSNDTLLASLELDRVDVDAILPLTPMQRDIYLDGLINPLSTQSAIAVALPLPGTPDIARWQQSLDKLIAAEPVLRTEYIQAGEPLGGQFYQVVKKHRAHPLQVHDWRKHQLDKDAVTERLRRLLVHPYDVAQGELFNHHLIIVSDNQFMLAAGIHHVVTDGMGISAQFIKLASYYQKLNDSAVEIPVAEQTFQQALISDRRKTDRLDTLNYWRELFATVEPLVFTLPSEKEPPNASGKIVKTHVLSDAHWQEVVAYCRKSRIVPALYFKVLYGYLIKHYCRASADFDIIEFSADRDRTNLMDLGIHYKQLPIVFTQQSLDGEISFDDALVLARKMQKNSKPHRYISMSQKLRMMQPGPVAFTFNYFQFFQSLTFEGQEIDSISFQPVMEQSVQFLVDQGRLQTSLNLEFDTAFFRDYDFLARINHLSEQLLKSPGIKLRDLDLVLPAERDQFLQASVPRQPLVSANADPQQAFGLVDSVATLFEQQVARSPDATAVRYLDQAYSYQQLNERANQLAHHLKSQGVQRNHIVAICLPRGLDMIAALWGVLKSGAAYLPLDPGYPSERLAYILKDSQATALIVAGEGDDKITRVQQNYSGLLVDIDAQATHLETQCVDNPELVNQRDDLIYVIYTSGSTGMPKGVALKHRGELNLLNWYVREFSLDADVRVMMLSAFGFDLTQKNLLGPLVAGAELILPAGELIDSPLIAKQIDQFQVSLINCAPSVFYPLVEACEENNYALLSSLKQVIFGGESIQMPRLLAWLETESCQAQVINNYGPTECTDIAAFYRVPAQEVQSNTPVPIGMANDNVALYLVNDDNQLIPQGLIGELCIAGEGVGVGYLHQPELTDSVFETNPFSAEAENGVVKSAGLNDSQGLARWYRSGDLMRYLPDHNLEFMGRKDFQVKVRGLRIEPGEIEWALTQSSLVEAAMVLAHDDRLIAFVIKKSDVASQVMVDWQWRDHLRDYVPDAMLPSSLCTLDQWPLTPNGKIDRKALPKLIESGANNYLAPRNAIEEALCDIWQQVLGLEEVGIEDNFFEIGGHSLLATRIVSRCRQRFQMDVPLRELFESPTIATLALLIGQGDSRRQAPAIELAPTDSPIPLSFAQQRLWFIDQLNPGNVAYLIPGAFKVSGELDREKFSQALMQVVQRHHILRTHIVTKNGEGWQEVYDGDCWQPQWLDLSDDNNQQQTIEQLIKKNSNTALNLEQDTLFNITLVKLSDTETLLLSCMHHIVSDGWSFGILLQELAYYYGLKSHQLDHELPPLPVQYGDYSLWQRNWIQGDVLESHIDFWRQHLQGAPATLNLPFDRPRPKVQNFEGANYEFSIDAQLSEQLKSCAVENQLTLFMLLLGAYKIQLSRYSGQSDICVGLPVAGRDHAPTEQLIGLFLNAIVLRTRFEGNASLEEYYQGIKTSLLGCLAHQDLPAEILLEQLNIERNLSHAPVAQVGFQLQNFAEVGALPAFEGLALEAMPMGRVSSKYDMTFIMREGEDGLGGVVEYSTALFDQSSIELFVAHFKTLLSNIVVSLQQGVDDVALVTSTQLSEEFSQSPSSQNPNPVEVVSLTHMQRDLVFLSQVTPDTLDNCFGGALIFPSPVDADLLYQALANIAARSSILRSRIGLTDKSWLNNAYRTVWSDMQADWRIRTDIEFKDAQYTDDYIRNFIFRPYDLSNNLMRFELLQQKQQSTLIVGVHHALLDGMGVASMVATLLETYHGLLEQKDFELPDEYFPVYLAKERSNTDTPKAIRYWRDKLSHTAGLSQWRANPPAENSNALLATQARVMTRRTVVLEDDHWLAVKKYCRAQRITPALYFKGLFGLLIELYCRPEEDFSIFELSADLLGMKLNAAGCTVQRRPFIFELETLRSSQRLDDYFKALREEQRVVNKSGLHTSIMMQNVLVPESRLNFMYNYYHFTRNFEVAGHNYDTHLFHNDVEQIHLVVNFNAGQLGLGLHFPEGAFEDLQFVERLESISQQIIAGGKTSAAETMADLAFTLADEKSIIQQRLSGETKAIELLPRVSNEFERSQGEHADRIAVKAGESQLLYSELNQRANCLAARLLAQGVDASSRVAVCLARSPELMIALVAVMKTGASYVPIDSAYPRDRIAYIIEDSGAALLLTSASLESRLPETTVPYLTVEDNSSSSPDLQLPSVWPIPTALDDIFYIIYTSGSTGQPKGAAVKQQGVSNLLDWYRNEFTFDAGDAHLVISAFGFDLTQKNLWLPLLTGACIYFPEDAHYHPGNLLTQIAEQKITTINCAPSAFYGIVDACEGDFQALSSLRWVILGGEAILLDRLRPWLSAEQCNAKLVNNYGPTECTDIAAFYRLEDLNRSTVPIGGPNTNVNLHLVNDAGQPVPQGVVGELCISGAGVGAGYLNKPELTEQVFQRLPEQGDHYWYRSGDLMCLLPDGDLEFVGRKDFQIKLRGMRIELQEVEAALLAQQGVEDCLVLIDHRLASESDQNAEDLERLVAYVIGPDGLNETNWLRTLGERLPQYMIPSTVAVLDQWPLTPNGKVDRKALPKLEAIESTPFMAPRNDIEETLAQIWCEVLGLPRVGVWDNFFQIGGNSLIAVRIMARMEKSFDSKFSLSMLFTAQNIAELSQLVSRHVDPESWSPLVLIKEAQLVDGDDALAPLYLIHPVGGTILCYHALAEALQKHQPKRAIYGLQCSGLEADQAVLNRFELMAAYYLEAIQVIQPEGPYYLAGQSLGGNIAWEMAQQLSAQNKTVALVGLIDSFVPQKIPAKFRQQNSLSMLREQMGASLDLDWQALEAMDLEAQIETFFHAAQAKGLMSAEVGLAQVQRIAHVMKGNGEALLDYEAQACDVSVVHVRASENQNGDSSLGWGELTTGDLVSHTLVASHDGILQGKSATELSALFKGPLKRDL